RISVAPPWSRTDGFHHLRVGAGGHRRSTRPPIRRTRAALVVSQPADALSTLHRTTIQHTRREPVSFCRARPARASRTSRAAALAHAWHVRAAAPSAHAEHTDRGSLYDRTCCPRPNHSYGPTTNHRGAGCLLQRARHSRDALQVVCSP